MLSRISRNSILLSMITVLFAATTAIAQTDPNPNSPSPVLISGKSKDRVLAVDAMKAPKDLPTPTRDAFKIGDEVSIFVSGPELLPSEKANAFRIYAKDSRNRMYRFEVNSISKVSDSKNVWALRVNVKDTIGFWPQPAENGDVAIRVTWRGMTSNELLLGIGKTGGMKLTEKQIATPKSEVESKGDSLTANLVGYRWSGDRKRLLEQATFGTNLALDHRVRRIGPRIWLEEQLNAPYPSAGNPYPDIELKPGNVGVGCPQARNTPEYRQCVRTHYSQYPLLIWFNKEALYGKRS